MHPARQCESCQWCVQPSGVCVCVCVCIHRRTARPTRPDEPACVTPLSSRAASHQLELRVADVSLRRELFCAAALLGRDCDAWLSHHTNQAETRIISRLWRDGDASHVGRGELLGDVAASAADPAADVEHLARRLRGWVERAARGRRKDKCPRKEGGRRERRRASV